MLVSRLALTFRGVLTWAYFFVLVIWANGAYILYILFLLCITHIWIKSFQNAIWLISFSTYLFIFFVFHSCFFLSFALHRFLKPAGRFHGAPFMGEFVTLNWRARAPRRAMLRRRSPFSAARAPWNFVVFFIVRFTTPVTQTKKWWKFPLIAIKAIIVGALQNLEPHQMSKTIDH